MADIPFEHAPEEVEVLPIEAAELSAPATLIEEPGTLLETAGETEEVINRIEHTKKNGKTIERKREAHTAEEHTNGKGAELSGAEITARAESVINPEPAGMSEQEVQKPAGEVEEPQITGEETPVPVMKEARVVIIDTARAGAEELIAPVAVIEEVPLTESATLGAPITERRQLVKSAALVSIGNLGSSLMGMARQIVVASLGPSIGGPFNAALAPANNFFQLLINGSVSGALVPTFNDYAAPEKRQEMRRVVFTVVNLIFLLALVASVGYVLIAPWFINVLVQGYSHQSDKLLTLQYSQIIFFSLAALGPFAVLLSALFALKEFGWPAFATAAYHVGIILGAIGLGLFGSSYLGRMALPAGVLLGALGEIALP